MFGGRFGLSVTDPNFTRRALDALKDKPRGQWYANRDIGISEDQRLLLTVSLGEEYNGYRYKLVAAVIGLPA